jgi:cytochrome c
MKPVVIILLGVAAAASVGAAAAEDAAAGEQVFSKCKACHQVGEGARNKVGPS